MDKSGILFVALLLVLVAIVLSLTLFDLGQQIPAILPGEGFIAAGDDAWAMIYSLATGGGRGLAPAGLTAIFKPL